MVDIPFAGKHHTQNVRSERGQVGLLSRSGCRGRTEVSVEVCKEHASLGEALQTHCSISAKRTQPSKREKNEVFLTLAKALNKKCALFSI